jgi:hypothetical protein
MGVVWPCELPPGLTMMIQPVARSYVCTEIGSDQISLPAH